MKPILPRSVQIVLEDKPLLRIRCGSNDSTDYELNSSQLLGLARQALAAHASYNIVSQKID